jgi:predicted DNA-binding transcriptional regulator
MKKSSISPEHFTIYPNQAFIKIREHIKAKRLNEIDISVYFVILDQFYRVSKICEKNKKEERNVSVTIQHIATELKISKTYATKRLKALADAGMIDRDEVPDSYNGNKNTQPLIYWESDRLIDNHEYINYTPPIKIAKPNILKNKTQEKQKEEIVDVDEVPF